jgi:hypothetical protein
MFLGVCEGEVCQHQRVANSCSALSINDDADKGLLATID